MDNQEKLNFIKANADTIKPLIQEGGSLDGLTEESVDRILEIYKTKIFRHVNVFARPDAKRLLLEASQSANFAILEPLTTALKTDEQCREIVLLSDNVAGQQFLKQRLDFKQVEEHGDLVLADIPSGPYDAALVLDEPENSPAPMLLASAKGVFGAARLYFFSIGLFDAKAKDRLGDVDAVLTTDEITAKLTRRVMGEDGPEILPIGSPLIDAVDPEAGNLLGIEARQTLGITPSARVLFYSSVVPSAFTSGGVDTTINDSTFAATLNGMRLAAERNPSQDFVLLLRMHPRMKGVYAFPNPTDLPTNLKLIGADHLSYDETVYAADIIACNPLSTEVIVAPYRGRGSVVLAYEGEKQFGEAIEGLYGSGSGAFLSDECGLSLVRSEDMLATAVETYTPVAAKPKPTQKSLTQLSATLLTS